MDYFTRLERIQNSPASRVSVATHDLNYFILEHDTTYVIVLSDPRAGGIYYQHIRARTLSMMVVEPKRKRSDWSRYVIEGTGA
jgi:hypothetical protein